MYTCKRCNSIVEDKDRFCHNCGAYIGEPVKKKEEWQQIYGFAMDEKFIETVEKDEKDENIEELKNDKFERFKAEEKKLVYIFKDTAINMIIRPASSIDRIASTLPLKLTVILTFFLGVIFSLIATGSIRLFFKDTDKLMSQIFSILSLNNLGNNLTNIPESIISMAVNSFCLFIFASIMFFCIAYLTCYYFFKASCKLRHLWNVIILSFIPLEAGLMVSMGIFLIMPLAGELWILAIIILWIISLHKGIKVIMNINEDKSIYAAASGCIAIMLGISMYIYILMK